jgi:hypothetical protein
MPRKVRAPLPPTTDSVPERPAPPLLIPGSSTTSPGDPAARRPGKPGPKSKAEIEAEERARREASMLKPDEMRPLTALVLSSLCQFAKGEPPEEQDIDLVNPPATMVANKYAVSNKYAPELALLGACYIVVSRSRERKRSKYKGEPVPIMPDRAEDPMQAARAPDTESIVEAAAAAARHR